MINEKIRRAIPVTLLGAILAAVIAYLGGYNLPIVCSAYVAVGIVLLLSSLFFRG